MTASFAAHNLKLLGTGNSLPGLPVDNATLTAVLEATGGPARARTARRIAYRLGIRTRHVARDLGKPVSGARDEATAPALCRDALGHALAQCRLTPSDLDYLIGHTASPDTLLPPNIAWVADELDYRGPYLELRQACAGFANGLQIASAMIAANGASAIGIVGSENGSSYFPIREDFLDTEQLVNFVQMGDGAGAVIVGPADDTGTDRISDIFIGQVGTGREPGFSLQGGGSGAPGCPWNMPVFRHRADLVRSTGGELFRAGLHAIAQRGYPVRDFDWILPHQVNGRLGALLAKELGIAEERVFITADTLGNLGSAAIWVSLDRLRRSGQLQRGQQVLVLGAEATKYIYGGFIYRH